MDRSGIAAFWRGIYQILQFRNTGNATSSHRINALRVFQVGLLRLAASQSDATLERRMPRERPPTQSAHSAIMGSNLAVLLFAWL
jgi:hypothetical protein